MYFFSIIDRHSPFHFLPYHQSYPHSKTLVTNQIITYVDNVQPKKTDKIGLNNKFNIIFLNFPGSTERRFLENIDEIVTRSLPKENLKSFFQNKDVAETYLLNQATFCEEMVQVHSSC